MDSLKRVIYDPKKDEPFYISLTVLRVLRFYPNGSDPRNFHKYRAVSVLLRLISTFVCWECFLHIFMSIKNGPYVNLADDLVGVMGVANCFMYGIIFQYSNKRWSKFFFDLTDTVKFGTPPDLNSIALENNRYSMLYVGFCVSGCVIYSAISFVETGACKELNVKKNAHEICGTISPLWWPNDEINPWTKSLLLLYQFCCIGSILPSSGVLIFLPLESVRLLSVKYKHLKQLIHQLFEDKNDTNKIKRMRYCIRYHQELLRLAQELNHLTKSIFGHISIIGALILSTIGYQMLEQYSVGALMHLTAYSVGIFFLCASGQVLKDETSKFSDDVYMTGWYNNVKLAKEVQLVMQRSQKPVLLESYMFGDLDHELFVTILKTSYSYLTLLTTINNESMK